MRRREIRSVVVGAAAVVVLLAGACSSKAGHAPVTTVSTSTSTTVVPRPAGYVALGDSYTAGGGAPPYDVEGACAVSSKGYPYAVAGADPHVHLVNVLACGGARSVPRAGASDRLSLLTQLPRTPDDTVGLVTFTTGGNDTTVLEAIVACGTLDCSGVPGASETRSQLAKLTDTLATKVYPALRAAYPKARLVHVGYPLLFSTRLGETCPWLAPEEETVPNKILTALDAAISAAVSRSGQVEYLDVGTVLKGHELCSADPWANDVTAGLSALHPNAAGYLALGRAIATALAR